MRIQVLGSAAGGRFPQWNCGCANCRALRQGEFPGRARTQAQLALSADGSAWFLAGASPDLAFQIESSPELHPGSLTGTSERSPRDSPIAGVVLGSCDLDHVLGLLLLRELQPLRVYAAPSILRILREENSMFGMLNRVEPQVIWESVPSTSPFPLLCPDGTASGLYCEFHYLSGRYPKYVTTPAAELASGEASAATFFSSDSGRRVAYVPAVGELTAELLAKMDGSDLLLLDGTFWSDDELIRTQGSGETAHQMGHIPIEESLRLLKNVSAGRKMFIHLNNTNPVLNETSAERAAVRAAGWEVAEDNWQVEL